MDLFAKNKVLALVILLVQNQSTSWPKVSNMSYMNNTKGIVAVSVSRKESISE